MKNNNSKIVYKRHAFFHAFFLPIMALFNKVVIGCQITKTKLKKDENVLVLSNHQTDFDPILMFLSFNKPMYVVATDTLLSNGTMSKFLRYTYSPLPKKKGMYDIRNVIDMIRVSKEGGSIVLFPEGNRTYAEFQFSINMSIINLIRKLRLPVLLYNIKGGNGVMPRFYYKKRKGPFTGQVVKRIELDEYDKMSDEDLLTLVTDTLRVYDSDSGHLYKSKKRAMYLENMLYICPVCHSVSKLHSDGNYITCQECGLKVEFTEDLHLKSDNPQFPYSRLIEWYNSQIEWTRNFILEPNSSIFEDEQVKLYKIELYKKRKLLCQNSIRLTSDEMIFGDYHYPVTNITVASPIGGRRMSFTCDNQNYLVVPKIKRFNPLKYVFMLNKLDSGIQKLGYDKNFSIS